MSSGRKLRMTRQRRVILEEIRRMDSHPTADELYARVRGRLPRISMGTVYRNLEILHSMGLISRLEPAHHQMRFEPKTAQHYHLTCVQCGKIEDRGLEPVDNSFETLQSALGSLTKFGIFSHRLEFFGLCSECRAAGGMAEGEGRDDREATLAMLSSKEEK